MACATEITKVRIVIRHLLWQIRDVRNDRDAAWKWVNRFANTLQYQDLEQDPDQYALDIIAEARSFNDQQRRKGQMLGVRKQLAKEGVKNPTQEQMDDKWLEMYGNEESPQDAPNGNAGDELSDAGNGAASKSPTSCDTLTEDGDIREGADESTTVSRNMRKSAKTRDTSASFRYAPPSCSPEDGNHYDQEPSISTDDPQPEGLTGPSHGGSVASLEDRQSRRTGGSSVRGMAKVAQPSVRPRAKNSRCPNSREEFHAFVADNNLHEGLAEEWYAMHDAREWVDRDGKPIKDWRGALYNYCTKTELKRRTA